TADSGVGFTEYLWAKPGSEEPVRKISYTVHYQPWGWYFMVGLYVDDLEQAFRTQLTQAGLWLALIGALLTALVVGLVRRVERSLGGDPELAVDVARRIAGGDLGVQVTLRPGDKDSLMAAMMAMRGSLANIVS